MRNGKAEEWLDNAKSNPNLNKDDLKVGVADQLRNIPGGAAGLQRILQTPEQKAALSWVVDDPAKVDNLSNFLRYEQRAASTDTAATSGLPGGTLNNQSNIDNPAPYIIGEVARGLPFGAPSGVLRGINAIKTVAGGGLTSNVKAKLASILSGDGQDLASGIENAKAYRDAQVALRLKSAKALGAGTVAATQFGR
jgi:hypothetical protein